MFRSKQRDRDHTRYVDLNTCHNQHGILRTSKKLLFRLFNESILFKCKRSNTEIYNFKRIDRTHMYTAEGAPKYDRGIVVFDCKYFRFILAIGMCILLYSIKKLTFFRFQHLIGFKFSNWRYVIRNREIVSTK